MGELQAPPAAEEPAAAAAPRKRASKKAATSKASGKAAPAGRSGSLSDAIQDVLAKASAPLRAKEVLQAAGLDETSNNLANVTAALGRLAGQGRAQRPSRGRFEAVPQG
ncbi:hypothetical protein [Kitasatospora sp. NPDC087315]|uniref:hypothetical protein n=1 Tax=Kitasatospora sp. NPDC087315 TaxID=3364069 RepID=UPI0038115B0A